MPTELTKPVDEKAIEDNFKLFNKISNRIRRFLLLEDEIMKQLYEKKENHFE